MIFSFIFKKQKKFHYFLLKKKKKFVHKKKWRENCIDVIATKNGGYRRG